MSVPAHYPSISISVLSGRASITIAPEVFDHVMQHRQNSRCAKEAGGQLFAIVDDDGWRITRATGPRKSDWRSRFGYWPNRKEEQREIETLFKAGLHYVGDWHTHPERAPTASGEDIDCMNRMVNASNHQLPGFLMMILGTTDEPKYIWLSFHQKDGAWEKCQRTIVQNKPPDATSGAS